MLSSLLSKRSASIYSGSGNTFLISTDFIPDVAGVCARYKLDGVIVYHAKKMSIFNADGSEPAMCGNGLRCLLAFLWDHGDKRPLYEILTPAGLYTGSYLDGWATITFPTPSPITCKQLDGLTFYCINTGVPHAVCLDQRYHFELLGARYVAHPAFGKEGSNITTYWLEDDGTVSTQTFERGVERITGACGTGCLAAASVAAKHHNLPPTITLRVPSGEHLLATLQPPTLQGKVTCHVPHVEERLLDAYFDLNT